MKTVCALMLASLTLTGCSVISYNRTFPKLAWYWSADAKQQRADKATEKTAQQAWDSENGYPLNRPSYLTINTNK